MKSCPKCKNTFENTVGFCPRDGEVLQEDLHAEMVGQVLDGQYEIEEFIAQGGMGAVYRARHILLGDRVVVKTLRSEMRHNSEWLRRFQREGRAARRFRHPNAVTVYDLRTASDGLIYMVMEYVEGRTLDKELKRHGRFSPTEALSTLEPVANVLDAAHAVGVVHRDLKPENIMIGETDDGGMSVKLLDLGIAKMVGMGDAPAADVTSLTVAGQLLGTPYFMSPEQWGEVPRDGGTEVDGRTDVYSLGLIFFEMIAGTKPFVAGSLPEMRRKHVAEAVPALNRFATDVPQAFSAAVARAMSKDRSDRHRTAGELVNEMRVALGLAPLPRSATLATASMRQATEEKRTQANQNGSATDNATQPTMAVHVPEKNLAVTTATSEQFVPPKPDAAVRETSDQAGRPAVTSGHAAPQSRKSPAETIALPPGSEPSAKASVAATPAQSPVGSGGVINASNAPSVITSAATTPPASKSHSQLPLLVGIAVFGLLLFAAVGVGGWYLWSRINGTSPVNEATVVPTNAGAGKEVAKTPETKASESATTVPVKNVEILDWWMTAFSDEKGPGERHATDAPITLFSGQEFKFHFKPRQSGYLYAVMETEGSAPVAVLTAQSGKTNQLAAGTESSFPAGDQVLKLDQKTGMETFRFIFSSQPLSAPSALTTKVGHVLTEAEQEELAEFSERHKANVSEMSVQRGDDNKQLATKSVSGSDSADEPKIFEIRIDHR
ncbi:MAG: protein kinase [Pyrinomonadaceae bacterium]|nr:protein kinase [Pyrinomonadaceae bacterium]